MPVTIQIPTIYTILKIIGAAIIILYIVNYFKGRAYLREYFQGGSVPNIAIGSAKFIDVGPTPMLIATSGVEDTTKNNTSERIIYPSGVEVDMTTVETPYTQEQTDEDGDYEYNMVYANESNTPVSKELRQKLMRQYPMHWTGYPPSSSQFQAGLQESFQNATQDVPDDAKPYQNISGSTMAPPDLSEMEREERKILQTYRPEFPPKATLYDERDARKLIKKIYDAKGLIPDVKHREDTNVYEIVGTRRKNEKVVYEDEAPASGGAVEGAGEGVIQAPFSLPETARSSNKNPWNYTAWTPGLEEVYSPSDPRENWT